MKNLKTILLGIFAAITLTEVSSPILGTRRREAYAMSANNQYQQAAAYQAGLAAGQNQNSDESNYDDSDDSDDSDQDVNTQSMKFDDYQDPAEYEDSDDFAQIQMMSSDDENYADDDANVVIEAIGNGSLLSAISSQLTPTQLATAQNIQSQLQTQNNNVQTQSLSNDDDDYAEIQAIQGGDQHKPAATPAPAPVAASTTTPTVTPVVTPAVAPTQAPAAAPTPTTPAKTEPVKSEEKSAVKPLAQAVETGKSMVAATKAEPVKEAPKAVEAPAALVKSEPVIEHKAEPAVAQDHKEIKPEVAPTPTPAPIVAPVKKEEVKPAPAVEQKPVVEKAPVKEKEVKEEKTSSIYNMIASIFHGITSAAEDMINYIYSFFGAKPEEVKQAEVKVQAQRIRITADTFKDSN